MTAIPKKVELLKGELVDFTANHKDVQTSSLKIAQTLEVQHSDITRVIKRLIASGAISQRSIAVSDYLNDRGKSYKYYLLKEVEALQVVMSLSGEKAEQLHKKIAHAFVRMKDENAKWREQALLATSCTKLANDNIHWLQTELAKVIPTSKRCTMLFVHVQQAITKAATGSAKIERSEMTLCQLYRVEQLEQQVRAEIERLRADGIPPEQIRDDVLAMLKATGKKEAPTSDQTERSFS
ncbi:MAG: hypothetical protein GQ547_08670 [Methylophaga sp.]|nr:hypothetical protein [Methylophaga sp.]